MAGTIKGLTIEIGGNTTKLQDALSNANKAINDTQKHLTAVNKALKLDKGNTDLLQDKFEALQGKVDGAKEKLEALQAAQAKLDAQNVDKNSEEYKELTQQIHLAEAEVKQCEDALKEFGSVGAQQIAAVGEKMEEVGGKISDVGEKMTVGLTAPIVGLATAATKTAADFESSMSQVQATMGITKDATVELNGETVNVMDTLSDFAKEMGSKTAFSASEAAEALNYMALAGYDVETSMNMLPTVLNLAAAGGIELANASDMVTDVQSALGLTCEETTLMVDQMAKTASKTNTSVEQLGNAFLTVGGTAKSLKGGTQELSEVLGVLADNGIKGSEGGTHLRNIMLSLGNATSDAAAAAMEDLNIQLYDTYGRMRDLPTVFLELQDALSDCSQEARDSYLNAIFNKADLSAVNALVDTNADRWEEVASAIGSAWYSTDTLSSALKSKLGVSLDGLGNNLKKIGIDTETFNEILAESGGNAQAFYTLVGESAADEFANVDDIMNALGGDLDLLQEAFDETSGSAQQMADTQLDNLDGQLTILQSGIEGVAISFGEILIPMVSKVVEHIQSFTDWLNQLSPAQQEMIVTIGLVVAAIGPLLVMIGNVISAIGTIMTLAPALGTAITVMTGPVGIAVAAIAALVAIGIALYENWDTIKEKAGELKDAVSEKWNALKDNVSGALDNVKSYTEERLGAIKDAYEEHGGGVEGIVAAMHEAIKQKYQIGYDALNTLTGGKLGEMLSKVKSILDNVKKAFTEKFDAIKEYMSGVVEWLKGIFDFEWELPQIKLPHFSISGNFSLNPPSVPSFSVDWYDKGGIFSAPTIIGVGEKRPEFVGALDDLREIVREENGSSQMIGLMSEMVNLLTNLNDGLGETISTATNGASLNINKREFARLVNEVV